MIRDKIKKVLSLFWTFFKIGLFTFGGGYAMIAIVERELVEKKKWIKDEEFADIIAIAESTPGPIAINMATFVGYKRSKFLGSLFSTLGVVLPSFVIIFLISFVFDKFLSLTWVQYAFRGIQVAVVFLIISAGVKMFLKTKKTAFNIVLFFLSIIALVSCSLFAPNFSSVFLILIGGGIGLIFYLATCFKNKVKGGRDK